MVLCSGKHCRRHEGYTELRRDVSEVADVVAVRCVDLCDSPVAVVAPGSPDAVVFSEVRTAKQRRDLVAFVAGDRLSERLAARQVTGKPRRRVLGELTAQGRRKPDRS